MAAEAAVATASGGGPLYCGAAAADELEGLD